MVHITEYIAALTISFAVVQGIPIQDEMAGMIHAQSFSELKHEGFVPMQRLGEDGLPINNKNGQRAASFHPIMVVPLPASIQNNQQEKDQRISASVSNNNKNKNDNNNNMMMNGKMLVDINEDEIMRGATMDRTINNMNNHHEHNVLGMDDQGDIKTVQLPATIHIPKASAVASDLAVQPSASSMMAKIALPSASAPIMMKNRKHVVLMDDLGKLQTLAVPMTTGNSGMMAVAPTPVSQHM